VKPAHARALLSRRNNLGTRRADTSANHFSKIDRITHTDVGSRAPNAAIQGVGLLISGPTRYETRFECNESVWLGVDPVGYLVGDAHQGRGHRGLCLLVALWA
jgi:hypothetical protein